ncbi:hypothetical protein RSJ44_000760 [Yersinia enterocolitica]|uniref:hypothetical protein n=1 Tax=Yersinia TaxID=629 RepID=UPI001C8D3455|nr:hypothetical protein [Yersinia enterocolitica]EKN3735717.1 hypothetical protein [Yersinia enterocolitica]EKN3945848.1 hypothetical protein [Yersinia enterocolitica]EKN3981750.1 hypothetical protein [Yersinia enterocolitica]EKN3986843.1 hypothetical protein [Yersinia enterocolitica]EKN4709193.1 hypothetical protein [Yersinia enterocolitica]
MKWVTVKNARLLSLLGLCLSLAAFATSEVKEKTASLQGQFQMGFYDLLSQQKEVYDARISATQGGYISTITSPNDNRFIFKGKFTENAANNAQLSYHYSPIFFNNPTSGKMIDGLLDYLTHNMIFMTPLVVEGQPLLVGQSGIVLGEK